MIKERRKTKFLRHLQWQFLPLGLVLILLVLYYPLSYVLYLMSNSVLLVSFPDLNQFQIMFWFRLIISVLLGFALLQWFAELLRRHGDVKLFMRSLGLTFRMWHALIRQADMSGESEKKLRSYNRAVKRVAVYLDRKEAILAIPIPWDNQAQQLLESQRETLQQKMSFLLEDYQFSGFQEKAGFLWLIGSRRA
ncbi:MAG: hypothetical protein ACTIIY_08370 [Lacticaseibacillus paracasei]